MAVASVPDDLGLAAEADPRVRYRRVLLARLAVVAGGLAGWPAGLALGWGGAVLVPRPAAVGGGRWGELGGGAWFADVAITVFEAVIAFVISSALGIVAGLLLARSPFWDDVLAPLVLALNSLPRVALAPLIILWFGIGVTAKVVTAFTL